MNAGGKKAEAVLRVFFLVCCSVGLFILQLFSVSKTCKSLLCCTKFAANWTKVRV